MEFISKIYGISGMKRKLFMGDVRKIEHKDKKGNGESEDKNTGSSIDGSIEDIANIDSIATIDTIADIDSIATIDRIANIDSVANIDSITNIDGIEERLNKQTLMQLQFPLHTRILCAISIMTSLIILVFFLEILNPNMILIAGLVLCSALFGYSGGITSAAIMAMYTLFYFSENHSFVHFTGNNLSKVIVSFVGITADMFFVCALKSAEIQAFSDIDELAKLLRKENDMLHAISMVDALTGIRNRMALRHDFDRFKGCEVTVMMLDLDNFKKINDTKGHDEGDRVLIETANLLAETFGRNRCYRYGGDEFAVVCARMSENDFKKKLELMLSRHPNIIVGGEEIKVGYSVGYIHSVISDREDLRDLFAEADVRMYNVKRSKKAGRMKEGGQDEGRQASKYT